MAFTVNINDQDWTLVPVEKLSFKEARELKRASGGMTPAEVMRGVEGLDADAIFSWIYVSVKREHPTLTVEELEASIGDTPILAVVDTMKDSEDDALGVATGPPAATASDEPAPTEPPSSGDSTTTPQA